MQLRSHSTREIANRLVSGASILVALMSAHAHARFLSDDASEIDREERLSTETYNDEISYRYPRRWSEFWAGGNIGYRVNAGSYNVTRFMFLEDIKVATDAERPVSLGFMQKRDENIVEQRLQSELRLSYNHSPLRVALLGDGSTFKQYGDIGLSVMFLPTEDFKLEVIYWSVDHYYNSKKEFPIDNFSKRPKTYWLRLHWQIPDAATIEYNLEYDAHTEWTRLSQDYYYDYARAEHEVHVRMGDKRGFSFDLSAAIDAKAEEKEHVTALGNYKKSLDRDVHTYELAAVYSPSEGTDLIAGVMNIGRRASYNYGQDATVPAADVVEPYSPTATRDEMVYYTTYYHPTGGSSYFQYGLFVNDVKRTEVGSPDNRKTEIKAQFAWDFQMDKYASVLLNTTWDVDQLTHDFPYKEAAFKPWGGGNIQFIAVF